MRLLLEVHCLKREFRPAVQLAERASECFREAGDKLGEARMLYSLARNATAVAMEEGAVVGRMGEALASMPRAASEAVAKAWQAADSAVQLCRVLIAGGTSCVPLLASALAALAQADVLQGEAEESLASSDEAVVLFRECRDYGSEGHVLLQSAEALRMLGRQEEALEAAEEAQELCTKHADDAIVQRARDLVASCRSALQAASAVTAAVQGVCGI